MFFCIWQGLFRSPSNHLLRSSVVDFKLYIELDSCGPHGPVQIASEVKTPARCRGQVQLLNLHDQVGPPRDASGFSLVANMLTTPSAGVPDFECWLKSNRPPRAGQGLSNNLPERNLTIKEISVLFTVNPSAGSGQAVHHLHFRRLPGPGYPLSAVSASACAL